MAKKQSLQHRLKNKTFLKNQNIIEKEFDVMPSAFFVYVMLAVLFLR